jgi:TetR/AcrR family fatty acid metabolism transcriptional regulator
MAKVKKIRPNPNRVRRIETPNNSSKASTRDRILESAKKLFAEQGYQKTTIVDISRQAGLSEAALYEYFQGKEHLLLTIPDLWITNQIQELEEQLFGIEGARNKLRKFLWWFLRSMERDPFNAKIVFLFLKTNANFMETEVYSNVKVFYSSLLKIFEEGSKSGELKHDVNPYVARSIFIGTIDYLVTRWLLKDMSYSLFENLEQTFDLLMDAFSTSKEKVGVNANQTGG